MISTKSWTGIALKKLHYHGTVNLLKIHLGNVRVFKHKKKSKRTLHCSVLGGGNGYRLNNSHAERCNKSDQQRDTLPRVCLHFINSVTGKISRLQKKITVGEGWSLSVKIAQFETNIPPSKLNCACSMGFENHMISIRLIHSHISKMNALVWGEFQRHVTLFAKMYSWKPWTWTDQCNFWTICCVPPL